MTVERQVWNPVTGWWENVEQPRSVTILATGAHLLTALAGLAVILFPPPFLSAGLGDGFLTVYWGALLLFGGLLGAFSVLPRLYALERVGLAAMGLALVLYIFAMGELQRLVGWDTNLVYQLLLNLALGLHVAIRWERVRHGMKDNTDTKHLNTGPTRTTKRRRR